MKRRDKKPEVSMATHSRSMVIVRAGGKARFAVHGESDGSDLPRFYRVVDPSEKGPKGKSPKLYVCVGYVRAASKEDSKRSSKEDSKRSKVYGRVERGRINRPGMERFSFWEGAARVLDLGASRKPFWPVAKNPELADAKAIESDWYAVGHDLLEAAAQNASESEQAKRHENDE